MVNEEITTNVVWNNFTLGPVVEYLDLAAVYVFASLRCRRSTRGSACQISAALLPPGQ
jgi:hypothetical protein